jgi:hypothetical protein
MGVQRHKRRLSLVDEEAHRYLVSVLDPIIVCYAQLRLVAIEPITVTSCDNVTQLHCIRLFA